MKSLVQTKQLQSARSDAAFRFLNRFEPSPDRWRWMTLASVAAGSSTALGGTVQISQDGNEVTSSADNLRADLTGDGEDDLPGIAIRYGFAGTVSGFYVTWSFGYFARAYFSPGGVSLSLGAAGHQKRGTGPAFANTTFSEYHNYAGGNSNTNSTDNSALVPVTFTDSGVDGKLGINGGQPTNGLLEVRAFSTSKTDHTVRLVRLVFDDASTAEPTGVVAGGTNPEFVRKDSAGTGELAQIASLTNKIAAQKKKLKATSKKLKKAKKRKQAAKAKSLTRSFKKIKKLIRSLQLQLDFIRANSV